MLFFEPASGEKTKPLPLLAGYGFQRMTKCLRRPGLHLAEYDIPATTQDKVDLALLASPIAGKHLVPGILVPARRGIFTLAAHALSSLTAGNFFHVSALHALLLIR